MNMDNANHNITDDIFDKALHSKKVKAIIKRVSAIYRFYIPYQELKQRSYIALFLSLKNFQDIETAQHSQPYKFSTSLFYHLKWQFKQYLREKERFEKGGMQFVGQLTNIIYDYPREMGHINDCLQSLDNNHRKVLDAYYKGGYTLKEIANAITIVLQPLSINCKQPTTN